MLTVGIKVSAIQLLNSVGVENGGCPDTDCKQINPGTTDTESTRTKTPGTKDNVNRA